MKRLIRILARTESDGSIHLSSFSDADVQYLVRVAKAAQAMRDAFCERGYLMPHTKIGDLDDLLEEAE